MEKNKRNTDYELKDHNFPTAEQEPVQCLMYDNINAPTRIHLSLPNPQGVLDVLHQNRKDRGRQYNSTKCQNKRNSKQKTTKKTRAVYDRCRCFSIYRMIRYIFDIGKSSRSFADIVIYGPFTE